jgi:hypothetical protein
MSRLPHAVPNRPLPSLPPLTGYCFGTGSASTDETITATLAAVTSQPMFITEGVGSGGKLLGGKKVPQTPDGHTPGNKNVFRGAAFGVGTDFNVEAAMTHIREYANKGGRTVNLCGWSRGAVTCFKITHQVSAENLAITAVNIFAFDPVPGDAVGNKHMWRGLSLGAKANRCVIILAQHDRRKEFHAAVPSLGNQVVTVDVMPGNHRSILQKTAGLGAAYKVNLDRCAKFLRDHGTRLNYNNWLPDSQILKLYTKMLRKWGNYEALGVEQGGWMRKYGNLDRVIKGFNRTEIARLTPASPVGAVRSAVNLKLPFFINDHHAGIFRMAYPRLHNLLRNGQQSPGWQEELRLLALLDQDTLDLVLRHFELIGFNP